MAIDSSIIFDHTDFCIYHGTNSSPESADPQPIISTSSTAKAEEKFCVASLIPLAEIERKVSYYDSVLDSPDSIPVRVIAKDLGLSAQQLNKLLQDFGIQYKQSGTWLLYQKYTGLGYTVTKTFVIDDNGHTRVHTYWTQKGRRFIHEILKAKGVLPIFENKRR